MLSLVGIFIGLALLMFLALRGIRLFGSLLYVRQLWY